MGQSIDRRSSNTIHQGPQSFDPLSEHDVYYSLLRLGGYQRYSVWIQYRGGDGSTELPPSHLQGGQGCHSTTSTR